MAEVFRFKPALLRNAQDWRLDGNQLHGPGGTLDLSRVTAARFSDRRLRWQRLRRLDLTGPDGKISIAINTTIGTQPDDPDRAAHRALIIAVAHILAAQHPELTVSIGEGPGAKMVMFAIGVLSLIFGLGIGIAAAFTGISGDRMAAAAAPMLGLVLFGGIVAQSNAPWRKEITLPATLLPPMIDTLE